jgi:hypothetical protein
MRKLSRKAITSAGIFGLIVVLIAGMFVANAVSVYALSVNSYVVPAASIVYDQNDQPVQTTQDSTIELRNGTDYYLKAGETEAMIPLGFNPVAYNVNGLELSVFGSKLHRVYQVFNDGSVRQLESFTQISDFENASFYKLSDRHYLFVGPAITNENGLVNAQNFLYVTLDRLGNVTLLNDEYNTKFLDPVTLTCNSVVFDVNNESLNLENGLTVDLTKIAGTSSLYQEEEEAAEGATSANPDEIVIAGGNGGNGGTGGTGGTGGVGGYGGEGGAGGTGGTGGAGGSGGAGGGYNFQMRSALSLLGAEPKVNSMDVDYAVMDPAMLLGSVFVTVAPTVSDTSGAPLPSFRQELNIEQYKATIYDLNPGTMYTVALGCKAYATGQDTIVDVLKVTTPAIYYNVNVLKVGLTNVQFNLKLDSTYVLDQTNVNAGPPMAVLYGEQGGTDVKVGEIPINVGAAISAGGWTSQIDYADTVVRNDYSNFSIKLEKTFYQGSPISLQSGIYSNTGASFSVSRVFTVEVPNPEVTGPETPAPTTTLPETPGAPGAPDAPAAPTNPADAGATPAPAGTDTGTAGAAGATPSASTGGEGAGTGL